MIGPVHIEVTVRVQAVVECARCKRRLCVDNTLAAETRKSANFDPVHLAHEDVVHKIAEEATRRRWAGIGGETVCGQCQDPI